MLSFFAKAIVDRRLFGFNAVVQTDFLLFLQRRRYA
jgi:hypothetical protein